MMYSNIDSTNISYAAAFVYQSAKDKSRRKISTVPIAFDVNSEICWSQVKSIALNICKA